MLYLEAIGEARNSIVVDSYSFACILFVFFLRVRITFSYAVAKSIHITVRLYFGACNDSKFGFLGTRLWGAIIYFSIVKAASLTDSHTTFFA